MTTQQLTQELKDGTVDFREFLKLFSITLKMESGKGLDKVLAGFNYKMKKLGFMWDNMFKKLGEEGLTDVLSGVLDVLIFGTNMLMALLKPVVKVLQLLINTIISPLFRAMDKLFFRLGKIFDTTLNDADKTIAKFTFWGVVIAALGAKFKVFLAAIMIPMAKILSFISLITIGFLLIEDLVTTMMGGQGFIDRLLNKIGDDKWRSENKMADAFLTAYESSTKFFNAVFGFVDRMIISISVLIDTIMNIPKILYGIGESVVTFGIKLSEGDIRGAIDSAKDVIADMDLYDPVSDPRNKMFKPIFNLDYIKQAVSGIGLNLPSPIAPVQKSEVEVRVTATGNTPIEQANANKVAKAIESPLNKQVLQAGATGGW